MKSFFTNLGKALLCGAVVAMIGCTDLHSDIKLVETTNNEALKELAAKLEADYATKQALAAAQEALNAKDGDLQAAIDDVKKSLEGYATNDAVNAVLAHVAELEAALGAAQEEVNAALAGLQAALETAQEEIYGRIETVEETLSASLVLIEDLAAEDEQIWNSFNTLQESVSALSTLLDEATAEHDQIYQQIQTVTETLSTVITMLEDYATKQEVEEVYAKIQIVEEFVTGLTNRVVDVEDALAIHLAAFEAYKLSVEEAIALATEDMQEYLTQMLNVTNDQIAEITALQEALVQRIDTLEQFCTTIINSYETADEELLALIVETKEELTLVVNNILNYLSDMQGQIDDLAARVQSLVFIPEYSDGKATIEWGLLIDNDSAVNFLLNRIITTGNINAFKSIVKEYIAKVKNHILYHSADIEASLEDFLANLVDEGALESALAEMFTSIQDLVAAEIYKLLQDTKINADVNLDVNVDVEVFPGYTAPGTGTANGTIEGEFDLPEFDGDLEAEAEKIASQIMADIMGAFNLGGLNLNLTDTIKGLLSAMKSVGVSTARELIDVLRNASVNDIIGNLNSAEFRSLLSKMLSVAKRAEAKVLENTALLQRESVIRYKVMGQNATALAAAIAKNPSVLSYDVETVDVRAAAPGLKITKVVAKGDEIHVSVVPQNFHYRFYLTYILEDSFLYGAAESFFDKYGKTGLISYSAALVLNDGNNIRSTEYVNFVSSENPEIFTPEVIKNGSVVESETIVLEKGADYVTLCEGMYMGYLSVPNRQILTKEQLAQKGFFGITEKAVVNTNNAGEAGPCTFNGLVGAIDDWYNYTFTTYWSVNDIVLAVNSTVEFVNP
ncbi:MAG: hypothetical protein IKY36_06510 [Bacteroidales bacterium]|nr:hypothetical protein [Bacteroidales bacterium]